MCRYLILISLIACSLYCVNEVSAQYFSHHHNFADTIDLDYGAQLLVSNDTIYMRSKRYKNGELIASISMLNQDGDILNQYDIDWAWALTNPYSMYKDGNRILYYQSDDQDLQEKNPNGLQMLVLDSHNLDSLSYHYYSSGYDNYYLYPMAMTKFGDHYVLSASTTVGFFVNRLRFFWINAHDLSLDTITTVFENETIANAIVFNLTPREDKLMVGYRDGIDATDLWRTDYNFIGEIDTNKQFHKLGADHGRETNNNFLFLKDGRALINSDPRLGFMNLIMVDQDGQEIWNRIYENETSTNRFSSLECQEFIQTADSNIIICGELLDNFITSSLIIEDDDNFRVGYLAKLNSESGDIMWERALFDFNEAGIPMGYSLIDVKELSDGSLIGTGLSYPNRYIQIINGHNWVQHDIEDTDTWIIRTSPEGCIIPESCDQLISYASSTSGTDSEMKTSTIKPHPNPVSQTLFLNDLPSSSGGVVVIYNMEGRLVKTAVTYTNKLEANVSDFATGMYNFIFHYQVNGKREILNGQFLKK